MHRLISDCLSKIKHLYMNGKREEVCSVCYKFLNTIYDHKKMKNIKQIGPIGDSGNESYKCKSIYHKKLTDRSRSSV
jgi:hypothetical protein